MKHMQTSFFLLVALIGSLSMAQTPPTPYYSIRSQGTDAVREMVGWEELINLCDKDEHYGSFALVGEYSQSFREEKICHCLFGEDVMTEDRICGTDCGECKIKISGSCVENRGEHDWLADYFGLPRDFESDVIFRPQIKNVIADLQMYWGAAAWAEGLYFRLNLPVTYSIWNLRFEERVINSGSLDHPVGYFGATAVTRGTVISTNCLNPQTNTATGLACSEQTNSNLLVNATEFFSGIQTSTIAGSKIQPLKCSKWAPFDCNCPGLHKTRPADLEMVAGWNFVCCEDRHFGINFRASAPTGNKPKGHFLFEPIVGNGHHWEVGGGLSMHKTAWRHNDSDASFGVYLDANITHLLNTCQTRSFDLCGKPNSRYMLAEKMGPNKDKLAGASGELSEFQFANELAPVANLTCSPVRVGVKIQGDVAIKFAYSDGEGMTYDLGYNFWGRSCEKIRRVNCAFKSGDPLDGKTWGLKGDAFVYGIGSTSGIRPQPANAHPIALAATESKATINHGTNFGSKPCNDDLGALGNDNIDNPELAFANIIGVKEAVINEFQIINPGPPASADVVRIQEHTSIQPKLLSVEDVDFVTTKGLSHKLFAHVNYTWLNDDCYTPFLGVGASAEFGQSESECCNKECGASSNQNNCCSSSSSSSSSSSCKDDTGTCISCALSQWSFWVKGGFAFN